MGFRGARWIRVGGREGGQEEGGGAAEGGEEFWKEDAEGEDEGCWVVKGPINSISVSRLALRNGSAG